MLSKRDLTLATLVAIVTLAFFVITLRPDVGGTEDSPKFQFVGRVLGTSHSPGYPFYAMATWAFGHLPIGNLAYRINLFSAVCGALCCLCIFLTARRVGVTRLLSVAAAFAAATSFPVWSNSITAEVYTLAAVLSGFAVYWLIAFAQTGAIWRLYAACAMWAMGFGNHLTIAGILPAAIVYGIYENRAVLKPRIAVTAALIGIIGVLQYAFIAIRTLQGAPYLEARATTVMGVFDVIIARDVSWARFYQAQSAVAAIEVPMLLNGLRVNMGTIAIALVAVAIVLGIRRRNAEVMLMFGAAAGTLGFIANLWGDVVGFITPVCVQLWPLAALGLQWLVTMGNPTFAKASVGKQDIGPSHLRQGSGGQAGHRLTVAGLVAMLVPLTNVISIHPRIEALRSPGEGPGIRALYKTLPEKSAIVAENYWLARLVNYMHFSGEVTPDPNPRVLDNDANDVRAALADGRAVYAFEGATHWLNAQGFRFERTTAAELRFDRWIAEQPDGTLIVAATAGRPLPFEWLPPASRSQSNRLSNYGVLAWVLGSEPVVEQHDAGTSTSRVVGAEGRALMVASNDDGPQIQWGDDVVAAIDRGLAVAAFNPDGVLVGQWTFSLDDTPGVQLPPTPYVLKGERVCEVLRPGEARDVTRVLAEGGWLATTDGIARTLVMLDTDSQPDVWKHRLGFGRGTATVEGSRLILDPVAATRAVFRLSLPAPTKAIATLGPGGASAVRVCELNVPPLPTSGALEVGGGHDEWFGTGWHLAERGGTQQFRWSQRQSSIVWKMDRQAPVRLILRLRPANVNGATVLAAINGAPAGSCALKHGAWTDCRLTIESSASRVGINQLTLSADTVSPSADRPGDARELSFVMQPSRVRVGQ